MPSPVLTSPKLFPWKSWVLNPKLSLGQAARGWPGKQQGSAENLLGRYELACVCQKIY